MRRTIFGFVLSLLPLFVGCASSTAPGAIGLSRGQLLTYPVAAINSQAAQLYLRDSSTAAQAGKLNSDPAETARVREISRRLIQQVSTFRSDAPSWAWEVNVIDQNRVNASCLPGGKIIVYTGLIRTLKLDDDELATVIGHEIGHALREHGREKLSQGQMTNAIVQAVANSNTKYASVKAGVAQIGAKFFVELPYSRDMELEADLMGLELMARAGYDPRRASNVWRKLASIRSGGSAEFLNTHPDDDRRIASMDATVPKVLALYQSRSGGGVDPMAGKAAGSASIPVASAATGGVAPRSVLTPGVAGVVGSTMARNEISVALRSKPVIGQDSFQVERLPEVRACNPSAIASRTFKGAGVEAYEVSCLDGKQLLALCDIGRCAIREQAAVIGVRSDEIAKN